MNPEKRRVDCPDKESGIYEAIRIEYQIFRYRMLSKSPKKVYKHHKKIYFYECINEYITYHETLLPEFIEAAAGERKGILADLWRIYKKSEYLNAGTWEGVEEILLEYAKLKRL